MNPMHDQWPMLWMYDGRQDDYRDVEFPNDDLDWASDNPGGEHECPRCGGTCECALYNDQCVHDCDERLRG